MSAVELRGYPSLAERALTAGAWHANHGRLLLSIIGVALGVSLGVAVHLINSSAINQFTVAARALAGDADLTIRGPLSGFSEDVYPAIARLPEVEVASPALEFDLRVPGRQPLHMVAVDPFQALRIQPALFGTRFDSVLELLEPDAVILSFAAAEELGVPKGGRLIAQAGTQPLPLRVIAILPAEANAQRIAFTDIATAQWKMQRLGVLNRIDIKVAANADVAQVADRIAKLLPAGVQVGDIDVQSRETESMTRAYRVNLNMLALVALFTGSFLVFATQALTILQRRTEIAILRVIGLTRGGVMRILLTESMVIGALGAFIGLVLGYALAWIALTRFGADLGAGYFSGTAVPMQHDPLAVVLFFALGVLASLAGCFLPAWKAAASDPAPALKSSRSADADESSRPLWPGLLLVAAAVPLSLLQPIDDLPLGGYAAVGALLAGALWLGPPIAELVLRRIPSGRGAVRLVAVQQLRGRNSQLSISISAIVVSFSLMVAMLIMIGSFRGSLASWLEQVLPADAYVRAGGGGQTGFFDEATIRRIAALPAVARLAASRIQELRLDPDRVPISLLARDLDPATMAALPPLTGSGRTTGPIRTDVPPVWISEAAVDLYGWGVGSDVELVMNGRTVHFAVAGIWRDYMRQNGTLLIERSRYVALTGDTRANDLWVWLAPGQSVATLAAQVGDLLGGQGLVDVRDAAAIRKASLSLFDRTFAVTYLLEAVAVLIGLFGISVGFSSQVLARRAEFGMLRHIGVTRGQIAGMLGIEGLLAGAIGILYGLIVGAAISMVLIRVINRQSFHWSMDVHVPVAALLAISVVLVVTATATAVFSGRNAMTARPIAAVKDDW